MRPSTLTGNTPMAQPRVITPAAHFLSDIGKAFYNGRLTPFANDLGIKQATLQGWLKGKSPLRGDHPVVGRALNLVLNSLAVQERRWRERFEALEDGEDDQ
jgi:hypothetical protein